MGWAFLVKLTTHIAGAGTDYQYLQCDGKFRHNRGEARLHDTREEAETKAFLIVAKRPELLGRVSVVRTGTYHNEQE